MIASMSSRSELVSFIVSKVARLAPVLNKEGYTALEALRNQLEHQRTRRSNGHRSVICADGFKGFSASSIACRARLENTTVVDLSTLTPENIQVVSSVTAE